MTALDARPGETREPGARLVAFEARSMGSPLRLSVVVSTDRPEAAAMASVAWQAVRAEFEASDRAMSRFRDDSELTRLNRATGSGSVEPVSRRLRRALTTSDRARRATAGRFDPRVLADLERLGDAGALHGESAVDGRRPLRFGRIVACAGRQVSLPSPVDLGGIGKGLALRWATDAVERLGVGAFLLEAGGDVVVRGEPPDDGAWRIGIEDPTGGADPLAVIVVRDAAVVTSSVRRRRWLTGDRVVHHLIDPSTGEPGGEGLLAVTVSGPDPAWSEVWSKVLFLEGRSRVAAVARRRGLAAWWVADDGSIEMTAAGRLLTRWLASEAG